MPLLDISLVTDALRKMIKMNVEASPGWGGPPITVSPQPPDKLKGDHTLGLYLYHIREEAYTKSQDWPTDDKVPLRFSPMGVALYYLLTPHSDINDEVNQINTEQRMMGLAVKTLHDFPKLDESTQIGGTTIFPAGLSGHDNRLRIAMQPIQHNEAMQYWTAGQQALRLAAYYEVVATLLEPEPVKAKSGKVLTYGVHTFVRGTPRLDGSRDRIQFTIPGEPTPREVELQPAEVTYGEILTLFGSDLDGDVTSLVLNNKLFPNPIEVDPILWGVAATTGAVMATIQQTAGVIPVLPGIYGATVRVTARRRMPDGSIRNFQWSSNETPFAITPKIMAITPPGAIWTITGARFDPVTLKDDMVQIFVGPDKLTRITAGIPAAREFIVANNTTINFMPPAGLPSGTVLPLRLLINGAESAPQWITVP